MQLYQGQARCQRAKVCPKGLSVKTMLVGHLQLPIQGLRLRFVESRPMEQRTLIDFRRIAEFDCTELIIVNAVRPECTTG